VDRRFRMAASISSRVRGRAAMASTPAPASPFITMLEFCEDDEEEELDEDVDRLSVTEAAPDRSFCWRIASRTRLVASGERRVATMNRNIKHR